MDKIIKVKKLVIGKGVPKICVPIIGLTSQEIISEAHELESLAIDIVEWRVDFYEDVEDIEKVIEVLLELRKSFVDIPILFTFRTMKEGGKRAFNHEMYMKLNKEIAATGLIDLIDVELFTGDELVKDLISYVHKFGVKVIVSNHDFHKTPKKEEIVFRLCKAQELGADIPKIAVMPENKKDVLELLYATLEMVEKHANGPIITMSMAKEGMITRLSGEVFGSAVTFGAANRPSAPGQIGVKDLHAFLHLLHNNY